MKFSKKIVSVIVVMNILFTIAVLVIFWHTGNEPMTLIGAWFAFTTGELWALSSIRKSKLKGENKDE